MTRSLRHSAVLALLRIRRHPHLRKTISSPQRQWATRSSWREPPRVSSRQKRRNCAVPISAQASLMCRASRDGVDGNTGTICSTTAKGKGHSSRRFQSQTRGTQISKTAKIEHAKKKKRRNIGRPLTSMAGSELRQ